MIFPSTPYSESVFSNFIAASVFVLSSSLYLLFLKLDIEEDLLTED